MTNHIPPEVVQRPVRQRAQCLRDCYAEALARDPATHGRVVVQFVVDADGWVRPSHLRANETGDAALAECVAHQFVGLRLPVPEGGPVTVVYPLGLEK